MQLHVSAAKAGVDALTENPAVEWGHRHSSKCNRARADRRYRRNEALSAGTNQGEIEETHSPRPFRIDQRHRNSGGLSGVNQKLPFECAGSQIKRIEFTGPFYFGESFRVPPRV